MLIDLGSSSEIMHASLTEHPLRAILQKADLSGRRVKWAIELGEHDIRIVPRNATKDQVEADFVAKFTHKDELKQSRKEENGLDVLEERQLYVDDASNSRGSGAGMVFITQEEAMMERAVTLGFAASNNEAEYETLLTELGTTKELGSRWLIVHCDSQLLANQLNGEYATCDDRMVAYVIDAQRLIQENGEIVVKLVGREENVHADSLASAVKSELRREILIDFQPSLTIGNQRIMCLNMIRLIQVG
ncbi:hypothetical protein MRB53_014706 [Persea americana]|uniref:Uncharacterized protein n=1 Tax=Persea americana TaxID=3435 RepID=A0ACC2KC57_PERAE|nr:hypothetical protein MRB53_014706 [Persea americana]